VNNEEIILALDKKFNSSDELIIEHSVYHNLLLLVSPHNYSLWFLHNK